MSTIKLSRRAANYSIAELDCLLTYIEENPDLVSVKLGGQYSTPEDIRLAWEDLAEKITSLGGYFGTKRIGQEVKRKWSDLKSRVKAKAASLAMEADKGGTSSLRLTPTEERVLAIISRDLEDQSRTSDISSQGSGMPLVKVFSFQSESNSRDIPESEYGEDGERSQTGNIDEFEILEEIKSNNDEDKKRRISEAFLADRKCVKRLKIASEEEQLQTLCNSQQEMNNELRCIKDILKKCQLSIEKIALLKRAELRLKCAKYGVDFGDLFD